MSKKSTLVQVRRLAISSSFNKGMMGNSSLFALKRTGGGVERLQNKRALRVMGFSKSICLPLEYCLWTQSQKEGK